MEILQITEQYEYLQKVSRSFALTIPILEPHIADIVANAYLLCRIADTIEDDVSIDKAVKIALLENLQHLTEGHFLDDFEVLNFTNLCKRQLKNCPNKDEYELLCNFQRVVNRTKQYDKIIVATICKCLEILSTGMIEYIKDNSIKNQNALDRYCYFVAGVVGQMLNRIFCHFHKELDKNKLDVLAVSFGQGLQMTNIIKDRKNDLQRGASFFPEDLDCEKQLALICKGHIFDAFDFISALKNNYKLKEFCLINAIMALGTINCLQQGHKKINTRQLNAILKFSKLLAKSNILFNLYKIYLKKMNKFIKRDIVNIYNNVNSWH